MTCTCTRDELDNMPLVDPACPRHGRGPITRSEWERVRSLDVPPPQPVDEDMDTRPPQNFDG